MTEIYSLTFVRPLCSKEAHEETKASLWIRIGVIAFGTIGITIGVLILYKIPGLNHLGTTPGKVMIPVGVCLIGVSAILKRVKHSTSIPDTHQDQNEAVMPKAVIQFQQQGMTILKQLHIPADIWKVLFSWLTPNDLLKCLAVCKNWFALANDGELWKAFCSRNLGDFSPIVQKNLLTWKEVYFCYSRFSHLFSKIIEKRVCEKNRNILKYNPELTHTSYASLEMPQFFVHDGEFRFFIQNMSEVLVQKIMGNVAF